MTTLYVTVHKVTSAGQPLEPPIYEGRLPWGKDPRKLSLDPGVANQMGVLFLHNPGEDGLVLMRQPGQKEGGVLIPPGTNTSLEAEVNQTKVRMNIVHEASPSPIPSFLTGPARR